MAEAIFRRLISLFFLMVAGLGVVMLRRTLRGERAFTDRDFRFLFGQPKNAVLGGRMGKHTSADESDRMARFHQELEATNVLIDCMNEVINKYEGQIKLRGNQAEEDLDLVVSAMYGKANKTFHAILKLACLGFGEDALVLLRTNINLMINLFYILSENSVERAGDLIAYSQRQQEKYLRVAHNFRPPYMDNFDWEEINKRASRWKSVRIKDRASKAQQLFHYNVGYQFYSSFEHSDALALSKYIGEWNERGPKIGSEPSDDYVRIALIHNFGVMGNIFLRFCSHFSIEEPGIKSRLDMAWGQLGGNE